MNKWPYKLGSYSPAEVQAYCVRDADWQKVRLSMKGVSTEEKLEILDDYRSSKMEVTGEANSSTVYEVLPERNRIQIDNYINALKRGGQLDMQLNVRK